MNYIISNDSISLLVEGRPYVLSRSSPQAAQVIDAMRKGAPDCVIVELIRLSTAVKKYSLGDVRIEGDQGWFKDQELPPMLVKRLLDCMTENIPFGWLLKFIERLNANPSRRATQELYSFLEHKNIPITPDGTFLCYKAVKNCYLDKHSGKFSNHVGAVLTMPRNAVCDNPDIHCSHGFHCGSLEYVKEFASNYGTPDGDRIVIVEVDPADVVSIPSDCDCQKLRTYKYKVTAEFTGVLPGVAVRDNTGTEIDDEGEEEDDVRVYSEDDLLEERNSGYSEGKEDGYQEGYQDAKNELLAKLQQS